MNAWIPKNKVDGVGPITVGASQTDSPISDVFIITAKGALNSVYAIKTTAATVATGITAKLQTAIGVEAFVDSKTVAITGTPGMFYIKLQQSLIADQVYLPLLSRGCIVITTGAGDSVTVSAVYVIVED